MNGSAMPAGIVFFFVVVLMPLAKQWCGSGRNLPGGHLATVLANLGGAPHTQLGQCSAEQQARSTNVGAVTLMTGLFATLLSAHGATFVINDQTGQVAAGVLWGLFVLFVDRQIVMEMSRSKAGTRAIAIRMLLAMCVSLSFGAIGAIAVFGREIDVQLARDRLAEADRLRAAIGPRYDAQLKPLQDDLLVGQARYDEAIEKRDAARQSAISEADGSAGTRVRGSSKIYQIKKVQADKAEAAAAALEIEWRTTRTTLTQAIVRLNGERERELRTLDEVVGAGQGLAARLQALDGYMSSAPHARWLRWLLSLLSFAAESAPTLLKLMARRGELETRMQEAEESAMTRVRASEDHARSEQRRAAEFEARQKREDEALEAKKQAELRAFGLEQFLGGMRIARAHTGKGPATLSKLIRQRAEEENCKAVARSQSTLN